MIYRIRCWRHLCLLLRIDVISCHVVVVIVVEFVYSRHQIMNEGELKINQDNNSKIWIEMIVASFLDAILVDDIHANKQH